MTNVLKAPGLIAALLVLAAVLALTTAAAAQVAAQTASADPDLASITVDGTPIPDFSSSRTTYRFGVAGDSDEVTIAAATTHSNATWAVIEPSADADTGTDGHQVDLTVGSNKVRVRGTAEDTTTTETYTVWIDRGVTTDYGWKAADDFNTLEAAGNNSPAGIWSDGDTMWVSDPGETKIYAYNMATKARDASKDFSNSQLAVSGDPIVSGLWSDGETIWASHPLAPRISAFDLATKEHDSSKNITAPIAAGNNRPLDLWSDGTTMWVVDGQDKKIYAYTIATDSRDRSKEFDTLDVAGNDRPVGIWSNGTTMWVADDEDDKIYAYDMFTKARDLAKDFNGLDSIGNGDSFGMWGDDDTLWVVESDVRASRVDKIFSYNLPQSDDTSLGAVTVAGEAVAGVSPSRTFHNYAVDSSHNQVTITFTPRNRYAGASYTWTDDDADEDGLQMDLSDGRNRRTITVTAQNGDTQDHTLSINRGVTTDYGWKAIDDFYALDDAGIGTPDGLWSDGTTMWISVAADGKLYAYNMSTKARDPGMDFNTLVDAGNTQPWGLWSDGETMWVVDVSGAKIHAYNMGTKAEDSSKEFNTLAAANNDNPTGIWSDGETMWVADHSDGKIYAYDMDTKARDADKDVPLQGETGTDATPWGIWSDGTTIWTADRDHTPLHAYNLATKARDTSRDFNTLNAAGASHSTALWSDGETMWVSDVSDITITSFNMTAPAAPRNLEASPAFRHIDVSWAKALTSAVTGYQYRVSADDGATWSPDWTDIPDSNAHTTKYRVTNLTGNKDFTIQLRAVSSRGNGAAAELEASTTEAARTENRLASVTVNGAPVIRFIPDWTQYDHGVASTVTQVTIDATTMDDLAIWVVVRPAEDANDELDGYQINIPSAGVDVAIVGQAENLTTKRYSVVIDSGSGNVFDWEPTEDFDNLGAIGIDGLAGMWSDGTTMWVADREDDKIYAFNLADKTRDPDKDFDMLGTQIQRPAGLWSDGQTMWVSEYFGGRRLYAYNLSTKARDSDKDVDLQSVLRPAIASASLWSDGETIWIADVSEAELVAYNISDSDHDPSKNFELVGITGPFLGIWSDGTTMWVADSQGLDIYAYNMDTRERDPDKDFDTPLAANNLDQKGIWSDGVTMWVADHDGGKIYAYNMPQSDDHTLKDLRINDVTPVAFRQGHFDYQNSVAHTVTQVTIEATAKNRFATVSHGGATPIPTQRGARWMCPRAETKSRRSRSLPRMEIGGCSLSR